MTNTINLPHPLKQVNSPEELSRVWNFRKHEYKTFFKDIDVFENDPYDNDALIFYTEDLQNNITSTGRLTFDGFTGLPQDPVFPAEVDEYRHRRLRLVELGRFIILEKNLTLLKAYYEAFYTISIAHNIHTIMMAMRQKDISFHKHMMGAKVLSNDMGITFGSKHTFACVAWEIEKTKPKFFKWLGHQSLNKAA